MSAISQVQTQLLSLLTSQFDPTRTWGRDGRYRLPTIHSRPSVALKLDKSHVFHAKKNTRLLIQVNAPWSSIEPNPCEH
jgi:hypothetical protein